MRNHLRAFSRRFQPCAARPLSSFSLICASRVPGSGDWKTVPPRRGGHARPAVRDLRLLATIGAKDPQARGRDGRRRDETISSSICADRGDVLIIHCPQRHDEVPRTPPAASSRWRPKVETTIPLRAGASFDPAKEGALPVIFRHGARRPARQGCPRLGPPDRRDPDQGRRTPSRFREAFYLMKQRGITT